MYALTARLSIIFILAFIVGCQGQNADIPEAQPQEINSDGEVVPPLDAPQFDSNVSAPHQTILNYTNEVSSGAAHRSISLFDVTPIEHHQATNQPASLKESEVSLALSLNTDIDNGDDVDISILVQDDNVWMLDHSTGKSRVIWHSAQRVCDIQSIKTLNQGTQTVDAITETTHSQIDALSIIVETLSDPEGILNCDTTNQDLKSYFELSLDIDESDPIAPVAVNPISEGLASAQLIVGWRKEDSSDVVDFGYLGYSSGGQRLEFYNSERRLEWYQKRTLKTYDVVDLASGEKSKSTLLQLTPIGDFMYVLQLGLDLFVLDSYTDVFSVSENITDDSKSSDNEDFGALVVEEIFTDRFLHAELLEDIVANVAVKYLGVVPVFNDGSSLIIANGFKIYQLDLPTATETPNLTNVMIKHPNSFLAEGLADFEFEKITPFSQFELVNCAEGDVDCIAAHDLSAAGWQFITGCDVGNNCLLPQQAKDICVMSGESSNDLPTCTSSSYLYLNDLNNRTNDAEVIGFMQYGADYVSRMDITLFQNSLLIGAQLRNKDILLRYNYEVALSEPKILREQVLFGKDKEFFDLKYRYLNNELFIDVLTEGAYRSNECYRNNVKVACDLSNVNSSTSANVCTGKDLDDGVCFVGFREYKSSTWGCKSSLLELGQCTESDFQENSEYDTKWLFFRSMDNLNEVTVGFLRGSHADAVEEGEIGEGALLNPALYLYDNVQEGGSLFDSDASLISDVHGRVENVSDGRLSKRYFDGSQNEDEKRVEGVFDVIVKEDMASSEAVAQKHTLINTVRSDDASQQVKVIHSLNESVYGRPGSSRKDGSASSGEEDNEDTAE